LHFEHLIIFVDGLKTVQCWQWVRREGGKHAVCQEYEFRKGGSSTALAQRLQALAFQLEEEPHIDIPSVASRVRQALAAEKVTKKFYDGFKNELETFRSFIQGITAQGDQEWYASLMLNRLMFVYFIQKQGFLDDGDLNYLQNRLKQVQQENGQGKFQEFYRIFLMKLFQDGLGKPEARRAPEMTQLLGKVPYLNGGLFEVHDLERDNPEIQIPDEAFQKIFDFFDRYRWHLDERQGHSDNEINPDVLGYIFEKYINQKQMGAYYTKEDITGYIARNTVLPYLFDAAQKECTVAFTTDGGVWRLLKDDPDRYIYPPVSHGIARNARQPSREILELPYELPECIAVGIHDVSQRGDWNDAAPQEYGMPTETWRELIARRQRYEEVRTKLASGRVNDINDLTTFNLDICRFAEDVISQSDVPELVLAFFHALRRVSILDPACGSGAFLFAALGILEPMYTACLERMQLFLDDQESPRRPHHPDTMRDFRNILEEVDRHPNFRYYILKSIVINNLYGVDIMEEAVEICKLRLFLKLVAQLNDYDQIRPLPDIDFNIRPGNTLVGFASRDAVGQAMTITLEGQYRAMDQNQRKTLARINEDAEIADMAYGRFREQQTQHGVDVEEITLAKLELRRRMVSLRDELDCYLAAEYGIESKDAAAYVKWRASHRPFHWFVEFYGIMHRGGFDVIIGNPPYVEYSKVKNTYTVKRYATEKCGNLFPMILERSYGILANGSRCGMIIQHSGFCTPRMKFLIDLVEKNSSLACISFYECRPGKLFDGIDVRLAIPIVKKGSGEFQYFAGKYFRFFTEERASLFQRVQHVNATKVVQPYSLLKIETKAEVSIAEKLFMRSNRKIIDMTLTEGKPTVFYSYGFRYWAKALNFRPYFEGENADASTGDKELCLRPGLSPDVIVCVLNSSLFFWYYSIYSDGHNFTKTVINDFPFEYPRKSIENRLVSLCYDLMENLKSNARLKRAVYKSTGKIKYEEYYAYKSKSIIDEIDRVLAQHYGFTDEELDFIINYDIKYRMRYDCSQEDGRE
jgi:hypothetical protein